MRFVHVGKINVSLWGRRVGSLVVAPQRDVYAFRFDLTGTLTTLPSIFTLHKPRMGLSTATTSPSCRLPPDRSLHAYWPVVKGKLQ